MRKVKEIEEYMDEAFDKVWYCRTTPCEDKEIEKARVENMNRILSKYDSIPEDDWDYGYWSGIFATLRWVLGDEKDSLDT